MNGTFFMTSSIGNLGKFRQTNKICNYGLIESINIRIENYMAIPNNKVPTAENEWIWQFG